MDPFEFLVAGAERQFAEAGKVQNLSFWAFKILVRARRPDYQNPPVFPRTKSVGEPENFKAGDGYVDYCAWRRYSDLEWLRQHLTLAYPAAVVPPIPEKDSESTKDKVLDLWRGGDKPRENAFANPLVASRIRRLQLFFDTIGRMPEVFDCEYLKAFICLEDAEWIDYKAAVAARLNTDSGIGRFKSFFSKVKSIGSSKIPVFDEISGLGKIRKQQREFSDALAVASHQVGNMIKNALAEAKEVHELEGVSLENAGKPLPITLCYNGHVVHAPGHQSGVVRHIDDLGEWAWIDWGDGKLDRVDASTLCYPASGVCDPAVLAIYQHLTQMESYFMYISKRSEAQEALKLQDSLWFESQMCRAIIEVVDRVEEREERRLHISQDASKQKDPAKKAALEAEAQQLSIVFAAECTKVSQDYDRVLRVRQQRALATLLPKVGPITYGLLNDEQWEQRLAGADAVLPLLFDVPEEVVAAAPAKTPAPTPQAKRVVEPPPSAKSDPFYADQPAYTPPRMPPPTAYQQPPAYQQAPASPSSQADNKSEPRLVKAPINHPVVEDELPPPPPVPVAVSEPQVSEEDPLYPTSGLLGTPANAFGARKSEEVAWDGEAPPPLPPTAHDV